MPDTAFSIKKYLIIIAVVAFIIRLAFVLTQDPIPVPTQLNLDEVHYDYIGNNVAQGKGFVDKNGDPTTLRLPLYPLYLGIIYFIFGHHIKIALIFQALLGMITPIVVYYIAREFFSQKTSLLASVITALYTSYIAYAGKMMTENLFLPELALIILFVLRLRRDFSFKNSALLGLMLGLSSLTRGTTTPMLLLAPLWFLLFARRIFRERLQKVAVMWGVIILILSPWVIRNYVHFHKVFITSASGGMVMWMSYRWVPIGNLYQIERAYAYVDSVGRKNAKPEIFHQILVEDNIFGLRGVLEALKAYYPEETFPDNEVEFNHMVMEKVRQELFLKPKVLILKTVTEFVRFWHFLDDRAQYVFSYGVILPFFFAGLWLLRRKLWEMGLLLAFFIYIWGIETVFMAAPRYRLPFEIVMIVFSSYTLWELFRRLKLKIIGALIMAVVLGGNLYLKYNVAGFRQFIRQTAIGLGMPVSDKNFQYAPHLNNADSIKQIKQ